jgi:MOSC domain-containing protein YiiM
VSPLQNPFAKEERQQPTFQEAVVSMRHGVQSEETESVRGSLRLIEKSLRGCKNPISKLWQRILKTGVLTLYLASESKSMKMTLVSVNVSQPKTVSHRGRSVTTGIFKTPVSGRVMVRRTNLDGDRQADLSVHGGVDKAVYVYPSEHYTAWAQELGRDEFPFGQFGENLTVEGMVEETVHIGDTFRIGRVLLEVTQPRVPCFKLGIKMGSSQFPKKFLASQRTGYYVRVLEEGEVGAGDPIERITNDPERMTVQQAVHLAFFEQDDVALLEKVLRIQGLSQDWRRMFEEQMAAVTSGKTP